jgi:diguanylate cyclase (GGDEF)-like protein
MENFLYILPWTTVALVCAALLLATLIPLGRIKRYRSKLQRSSRLEWFSSLRKDLEDTKDIKQFGEHALRSVLRILGSTEGCVVLQGDYGKEVSHKVVQGLSSRTAELLMSEPLRSYFATSSERWGSLMVFSDLQKSEVVSVWQRDPLSNGFIGIMKAEGFRTVVLIGLGAHGKWNGALLAGSRKASFQKSCELRTALVVANQLNVALESWSVKRTAERHNEESRVLNRVSLALRETIDFKTQIAVLRREMKDLLGNTDFALSLQSAPETPLEMVVPFEGASDVESSLGAPTTTLEEQVMRTRSPLVVSEEWRGASRSPSSAGANPRIRSWCGVPISLSDGTMGVLAMVDYHSPINARQLELFQVVAKEAAAAFENSRMLMREKERGRRLAILNEIGQRASAVLNPKELLPEICIQAQSAFGYEWAHIEVVDKETKELVVEAEAGYGSDFIGWRIPLTDTLPGAAVQSGKPAVADFTAVDSKFAPLRASVRSGVSVPLKVQDEILGVFSLESKRPNAFATEDVLVIQALANQVALALHTARTYQAAFEQAITDGLTGLKTHRYFMEAVEREWRRSTRSGQEFSIIMIDLDQFKEVNDRYGHMQGDRVLRAVANVLSDSVRQSNVVARYGGDEFAVLMPEATTAQAEAFAERMRANIESDPLLKQHGITASIGIATFPEHGPTKEEILRMADAGMYLAKYQNGNSVRVGPSPSAASAGIDPGTIDPNLGAAARQMFNTGSEAFNEFLQRIEQASHKELGEVHLLETVTALARNIDFSDQFTRDHGQAVSRWAVMIARQLGMPEDDIEEVRVAGVLHDIGKVAIPMEILSKPGRLTPEEYALVKSHSVMGEKILVPLNLSSIKRISRMVRHHHETFDGTGYPDGLKGEAIPIGARILAVADSFDTIVSDRSYRRGRSYNDAIVELHRCCGTQFDPQLVDSFLRAHGDAKSTKTRI